MCNVCPTADKRNAAPRLETGGCQHATVRVWLSACIYLVILVKGLRRGRHKATAAKLKMTAGVAAAEFGSAPN